MLRHKLCGKHANESEFNNNSIKYRLNKLIIRVNALEKFNKKNEKEFGFKKHITKTVMDSIKLTRDVENISYNRNNLIYFNLNVKTIRKLEKAKSEIEEMMVVYQDSGIELIKRVNDYLKRIEKLLAEKAEAFEDIKLTYIVA